MSDLTKAEAKHIELIRNKGWMQVARRDALIWRKRQTLDGLVARGFLVKYWVSPTYDGYELAR